MTLLLLITAVGGAWADETYTVAGSNSDMFGSAWDATYTANDMTKNGDGTYSITYTNVYLDGNVQYKVVKDHSWNEAYPADNRVINIAEAGTYTLTIHFNPTTHEVYETMPGTIEVTLDDAKTTASFKMPQYDVTATYTIKRDISVDVTATMGDGTDGVRYRVKKNEQTGKYEPAEMNMMQVLALVAVNDGIEQKALTLDQDYFCRIYKLDEQTLQPLSADGVKLADFDFAPGLYALKAFAKDGSDYDGETALSNTFKLFQGYEVEVPAGEYVTYYKDENLYVEDEDAKLYTITSVGTETATAAPLTVAKAYTPILVKNKGAEKKMILLIPTETEGDDVTAAPEFIGTLEATTIAASTENQNNYAFNGKQFVWVKNAIEVGPNKAWLSINTGVPSARITIVFDETTGIDEMVNGQWSMVNGTWYDLNGRKLDKMPTKKGVYIMNGKKVVVK